MTGKWLTTPYGRFPPAWQFACLSAICVDKVGIQTGPFGSQLHQRDYVTTGTPIITVEHLGENRIIHQYLPRVSEKDRNRLSRYLLQSGDIVFSRVGSVDLRALVRKEESGWLFSGRLLRVRVKPDLVDSGYLSWFFGLPSFREYVRNIAFGATMPSLNTKLLSQLPVCFPSMSEQKAIAHILGTLDDKIELNRRTNKTLEEITQAIFKNAFIDVTEQSIRKGWSMGTLSDIAINPKRNVQPDIIKPEAPYIGLEHMPRHCIALAEWGYSKNLESNKFEFKQGEILFGKLRPYFHKVGIAPVSGVCSTDILVIAPKEPEWFGFVLGLVSSVDFVNFTYAASTGTKMPRTSWRDMSRYEIVLPPIAIAASFTERIRPMIEKIITNIHETRSLATLRDALLPKLLSGEIRIKDAEKFVGQAVETKLPEQLAVIVKTKATLKPFHEAILLSALVREVSSTKHPLGRKRYQKMSYFVLRKSGQAVTDKFLKKAAGPYNPGMRYKGAEKIALDNGYIQSAKSGVETGFIAGKNISGIDQYLQRYSFADGLNWVIQNFRYKKNDELELLATVDYAAIELKEGGKPVAADSVKNLIASEPEWSPKLNRALFSEENIECALDELRRYFPDTYINS